MNIIATAETGIPAMVESAITAKLKLDILALAEAKL